MRAEARRPEDAEAGQEELKHRPNQEEPGKTSEALVGRSSYPLRSFAGGPKLKNLIPYVRVALPVRSGRRRLVILRQADENEARQGRCKGEIEPTRLA